MAYTKEKNNSEGKCHMEENHDENPRVNDLKL